MEADDFDPIRWVCEGQRTDACERDMRLIADLTRRVLDGLRGNWIPNRLRNFHLRPVDGRCLGGRECGGLNVGLGRYARSGRGTVAVAATHADSATAARASGMARCMLITLIVVRAKGGVCGSGLHKCASSAAASPSDSVRSADGVDSSWA